MTTPELPPIIATVQTGDKLVFLTGDYPMTPRDHQQWRAALADFMPGVKVVFVPAVGVVHLPAVTHAEPRIDEDRMAQIREHLIGKVKKS